eukprot:gene5556-6919_t
MFLFILTTLVGVILGFTANNSVSKDVDTIFNNLEKTGRDSRDLIKDIVKGLAGATNDGSVIRKTYQPLLVRTDEVYRITRDAKTTERNLNTLRQTILIMGFILGIITCAWGVFSMANEKTWSFIFLAYLSLMAVTLGFICLGLHLSLSAGSSDFCQSLDRYSASGGERAEKWMKDWLECKKDEHSEAIVAYTQTEVTKLLKYLNSFSMMYTNTFYTFENITKFKVNELRGFVAMDDMILFNSKFNEKTVQAITSVPKLNSLVTCQTVINFYEKIRKNYCSDIVENLNRIIISEILIAGIWIPGFIFAVIYSKMKKYKTSGSSKNSTISNSQNNESQNQQIQA